MFKVIYPVKKTRLPRFEKGNLVTITSGEFVQQKGIISEVRPRHGGMNMLLVEITGKRITISDTKVEKLVPLSYIVELPAIAGDGSHRQDLSRFTSLSEFGVKISPKFDDGTANRIKLLCMSRFRNYRVDFSDWIAKIDKRKINIMIVTEEHWNCFLYGLKDCMRNIPKKAIGEILKVILENILPQNSFIVVITEKVANHVEFIEVVNSILIGRLTNNIIFATDPEIIKYLHFIKS